MQLALFGAIAEFERKTLKERQREGIEIALNEKRPYGRPRIKITDEIKSVYRQWKAGNITAVKAMKQTNFKKATFYNIVKKLDEEIKGLPLWTNDYNGLSF